jgi:phosphatidylglycerophosphatase A
MTRKVPDPTTATTAAASPGPRTFVDRLCIVLAFAGGLGLAPIVPGTFGSLPGLAFGAALRLGTELFPDSTPGALHVALIILALLLLSGLAYWTIARTEAVLRIHDDGRIVIDEVAGQAIAVAFLPLEWRWYLAGFLLFRALDMLKPGPIGRLDRDVPGALGTLGDDLLAGAVAGALLLVAHLIWPLFS